MDAETRRSALWASWLLIVGAILSWIGAFSPLVLMPGGELDASPEELLRFADSHHLGWFALNGGFLLGVLITALGFTALTVMFRHTGEHLLSEFGLVCYLFGATFWVMYLAFRLTLLLSAARETVATGLVPSYFSPLKLWLGFLFAIHSVLAYLSVAVYGVAVLRTELLPKWLGRACILFSLFVLVSFLAGAEALPLLIHVMPFITGVLLLRRVSIPR